jgi:hypothetical protein
MQATTRLALFRKRLTKSHRRNISTALKGKRKKFYKKVTDNFDPQDFSHKDRRAIRAYGKDTFLAKGHVLIAKKNLPGYLRRKTYILSSAEGNRPLIARSVLRADNYFNPKTRHLVYRSDTRYLTSREKLALSMGFRP